MHDQLKALIEEMELRRDDYFINVYYDGFKDGRYLETLFIIEKLKQILEENERN